MNITSKLAYAVAFLAVFVCAFLAVAFDDWRRDAGIAVGCLIAGLVLHQLTIKREP